MKPIIPTEPPAWCRSPDGYRRHQLLLQKLVDYLDEKGVEVELPEERDGHDNGVDLLVGEDKVVVDLKSFWLTRGDERRWMSPFHTATSGKRSTWEGKETEAYIHADFTFPVDEWLVCRASGLVVEEGAPFYREKDVTTIGKLV